MLCTVPDLAHPVRWLEWAAGAIARLPAVQAAGTIWPRLGRYLTYLRISRQRRSAGWWCAIAAETGLLSRSLPGRPRRKAFTAATVRFSADGQCVGNLVTGTVTVDLAGAHMGGAARYAGELRGVPGPQSARRTSSPADASRPGVLSRGSRSGQATGRGQQRKLHRPGRGALGTAAQCLAFSKRGRRSLPSSLAHRQSTGRKSMIVRLTARRADVLVAPCSAMADRIIRTLPDVRSRIVVRPHPSPAHTISPAPPGDIILCPVIFESYKRMTEHISGFLMAVDKHVDPAVRLHRNRRTLGTARQLGRSSEKKLVGLPSPR